MHSVLWSESVFAFCKTPGLSLDEKWRLETLYSLQTIKFFSSKFQRLIISITRTWSSFHMISRLKHKSKKLKHFFSVGQPNQLATNVHKKSQIILFNSPENYFQQASYFFFILNVYNIYAVIQKFQSIPLNI